MKIQPIGYSPFTRNELQSQPNCFNNVQKNMTDVFVKNTNISFSGNQDGKMNLKEKVTMGVVLGGLIGLYGYGTHKLATSQQPEEIFLSDGTYLGHVDDFKVESDKMHVDLKKGIIKVEGTGIDIDASKCDYAEPLKGIYKNNDGSIDVDFANGKFIDTKNGIFMDIPNKIAMGVDNGIAEDIPIICFEGSSHSGGVLIPPCHVPSTMVEDNMFVSLADKFKNASNMIFGSDFKTGYMILENGTKMRYSEWLKQQDLLSRDFEISNQNGQVDITAFPSNRATFDEFFNKGMSTQEAIDTANTERLQEYLNENNIPYSFRGSYGLDGFYADLDVANFMKNKTDSGYKEDPSYIGEIDEYPTNPEEIIVPDESEPDQMDDDFDDYYDEYLDGGVL